MKTGSLLALSVIVFLTCLIAGPLPCRAGDTGYTVEIHSGGGEVLSVNSFSIGGRGRCGGEPGTWFCGVDGGRIPFHDVRFVEFVGKSRAAGGGFVRNATITDLDNNTRAVTLVLDDLSGVTSEGLWVVTHDRWDPIERIVFARWGD